MALTWLARGEGESITELRSRLPRCPTCSSGCASLSPVIAFVPSGQCLAAERWLCLLQGYKRAVKTTGQHVVPTSNITMTRGGEWQDRNNKRTAITSYHGQDSNHKTEMTKGQYWQTVSMTTIAMTRLKWQEPASYDTMAMPRLKGQEDGTDNQSA